MSKNLDYTLHIGNSIPPVDSAAATVNGDAVDTLGYDDAELAVEAGSASGSPTAQSIACKVQESADGSTGWADVTGAAITAITADKGTAKVRVPGVAQARERYLRAVATVTFTGGTTPAIEVAAQILLSKEYQQPTD